jgi:hypothetical protein
MFYERNTHGLSGVQENTVSFLKRYRPGTENIDARSALYLRKYVHPSNTLVVRFLYFAMRKQRFG